MRRCRDADLPQRNTQCICCPQPAPRDPLPAQNHVFGAGSRYRAAGTERQPRAAVRSDGGIVPRMPVIVIGADTVLGQTVATALTGRAGEVRAFVTDPAAAEPLRRAGIKVAVGDVSDDSHIQGAAHDAFSAVLIAEAASDDRERSFASSYDDVLRSWRQGVTEAGVKRIIWIGPDAVPSILVETGMESASIDTSALSPEDVASEAVRLDDLATIDPA